MKMPLFQLWNFEDLDWSFSYRIKLKVRRITMRVLSCIVSREFWRHDRESHLPGRFLLPTTTSREYTGRALHRAWGPTQSSAAPRARPHLYSSRRESDPPSLLVRFVRTRDLILQTCVLDKRDLEAIPNICWSGGTIVAARIQWFGVQCYAKC